jgi:hypothetical protein
MSRITDAILTGQFTDGYSAPMLYLRLGGQQGYAPNLSEWVSNQAYIQRNIICLLVEAPAGFQYLPEPDFWVGALKSLVELHPKSITGLNSSITVEWGAENAVSGGGEVQQDFTDVKRARSEPTFTWVEKYGRPIQTFLYEWITNLLADPDTKVPNIATLPGVKPTDLLADMYAATMLFIEPDPTHSTVVKAWLSTNMAPMGIGDVLGKRELSSQMDQLELSIQFTAMTQSTLGVRLFAQAILDSINFANANPNMAPAFVSGIQADVAAANTGYAVQAETLGSTAIVQRP